MSLTGKLTSQYRSKKSGQMVYVFQVQGSVAEKDRYRAAKGTYNVDDDATGDPLFYLTEYDPQGIKRLIDSNIELLITTNNNVVINTERKDRLYDQQVIALMALEEAKVRANARVFRQQPGLPTVRPEVGTPQPEPATKTPQELMDEAKAKEGAAGKEDISGAAIETPALTLEDKKP